MAFVMMSKQFCVTLCQKNIPNVKRYINFDRVMSDAKIMLDGFSSGTRKQITRNIIHFIIESFEMLGGFPLDTRLKQTFLNLILISL